MSGLLNISGTTVNEDPSFRYKMPRLVGKIEGRGNGIKTIVVNMEDIATSLNRPPSLPTKFFGCELGAQTRWEEDVSARRARGRVRRRRLGWLQAGGRPASSSPCAGRPPRRRPAPGARLVVVLRRYHPHVLAPPPPRAGPPYPLCVACRSRRPP